MAGERRGLLLDWGGVMVGGLFDSFAAFCTAEGLDPAAVVQVFRDRPSGLALLEAFECGRMPEADFEQALAAELGLGETGAERLIERLFAGVWPDEAMLAAVVAFRRQGIKTGLLSNSWGPRSYPTERLPELFDVLIISGDEDVRKPDPRIYALAAERMGMAPEELVFVDDLPGNLAPARAIGMHTIAHRSAEATLPELERVLGVSARA